MPKLMSSDVRLAAEKARLRKKRSGTMGSRARRSHQHEAHDQDDAGDDGTGDAEARPAVLVAAHQAPDDAEQAGAHQGEAAQVERLVGALALGQAEEGDGQQGDADGHVQPEDPLPGEAFHDGAADDGAEGHGQTGGAAPDAQGQAAAGRRHRCRTGSSG